MNQADGNKKSNFLSHLLPYDPVVKTGIRLKDGLKEYILLLTALEHAMKSLQTGSLKDFDPLVGENACQIRALKLALIIDKFPIQIEELLNKTYHSREKSYALYNSISKTNRNNLSLKDIIDNEKIEIELTHNEFFLVKCFLLTKVKTVKPFKIDSPLVKNEYTDTKKIKEIGNVGSMFADNLVKILREKVATSSVAFVQQLANSFPFQEGIIQMVSSKYSIKHKGLECLPCFWTTWILMQQAQINKTPIALKVQQRAKDRNYEVIHEITIFFKASSDGYVETDYSAFDYNSAALVLFGSSCRESNAFPDKEVWRQELLECNPIDLILAYAATHRQYPDETKNHLIFDIQDKNYDYYKQKAQEWGCCLENPSRFFLAHAYCEKIGNILI